MTTMWTTSQRPRGWPVHGFQSRMLAIFLGVMTTIAVWIYQPKYEWTAIFSITKYTQNDRWPKEGETGLYSSITETIFRNRFQIFWETSRDLIAGELADTIHRAAQSIFEDYSRRYKRFAAIGKPPVVKPAELRRKLPLPDNPIVTGG